jgi:dTDP-glucose pyrophosphorylase
MKEWKKTLFSPSLPLRNAVQILDKAGVQIALGVDAEGKLLGTLTDGDVRRALLRNISLDSPAHQAMNERFTFGRAGQPASEHLRIMREAQIRHLPLVDEHGKACGLALLSEIGAGTVRDNWVVLFAGGIGKRLGALTQDRPKPLIAFGEQPLLEIIVNNLKTAGFRNLFLAVHYKAEMIKDHFGDGSRWGMEIQYIEEKSPLGTAGALGHLPTRPQLPLIAMNSDLLTRVNFERLLEYHESTGSPATMCVRAYETQIPYGVVNIEKERFVSIQEKPRLKFFTNAGIYVLNAEVTALVPPHTYMDMTELFEKICKSGERPSVFPIEEYWQDIGQPDDLLRAQQDYLALQKESAKNEQS